MRAMFAFIWRWGEMIKFSHSVFALPFALMATFLASRSAYLAGDQTTIYPDPIQFLLIIACMVSARSVAMTFNRIVDAKIDARNPRTANRAIPAGTISRNQAVLFLVLSSVVFICSCAGFWWLKGNTWPIALSLPVIAYLCVYSYAKLFTQAAHLWLGSAIGLSPAAAWIAIHPASLGWPAIVLMGAVTFWIAGFDIIYACQDVQFDRMAGLRSMPARLGVGSALWIVRGMHFVTVVMLFALAYVCGLGWLYLIGVILVALLIGIENILVIHGNLSHINLAFFTFNGIISLLLSVLTIIEVLLYTRIAE